VLVVRWPGEGGSVPEELPRLFLVEQGSPPPVLERCLDDWVRVPAPSEEIEARVAALVARRRWHHDSDGRPRLDPLGVVWVGHRGVELPPLEARIARLLVERLGAVVSREDLLAAAWPGAGATANALNVHMVRLRRRLAPLGLVVRTVAGRGYLLARAADAPG
jgi:DNA-binding response OmpR family regulator